MPIKPTQYCIKEFAKRYTPMILQTAPRIELMKMQDRSAKEILEFMSLSGIAYGLHEHQAFAVYRGLYRFISEKIILRFGDHAYRALTADTDVPKSLPPIEVFQRLPFAQPFIAFNDPVPITYPKRPDVQGSIEGFTARFVDDQNMLGITFFMRQQIGDETGINAVEQNIDLSNPDAELRYLREEVEIEVQRKTAVMALHLIMYLCSEAAQISPRLPRKELKEHKEFKGLPRFCDELTVAEEVSRKLEFVYNQSTVSGEHQGGHVRSHIRRGHYHSYWTGSTANGRGQGFQKSILLWLPPTLVGSLEDLPITNVGYEG